MGLLTNYYNYYIIRTKIHKNKWLKESSAIILVAAHYTARIKLVKEYETFATENNGISVKQVRQYFPIQYFVI